MSSYTRILNSVKENRYKTDFVEIEKIGRGGFASVYKCMNQIDDHLYAIKKITLKIKDVKNNFKKELEKLLQEAKYLARVNHVNIVRYYNSWIEVEKIEDRKQFSNKKEAKANKNASKKFDFPTLNGKFENFFSIEDECKKKNVDEYNDAGTDSPLFNFSNDGDFEEKDIPELNQKPKITKFIDFMNEKFEKKIFIEPKEQKKSPKNPKDKNWKVSPIETGLNPIVKYYKSNPETPRDEFSFENLKSVTLYIQTELCSKTLEQYLKERNKKLSETKLKNIDEYTMMKDAIAKEAIQFARQVIDGLAYIHKECFLIHRDIKPSNIFLTSENKIKIGDFGLVKKLEYLSPMGPSPMLSGSFSNDHDDGFKLNESIDDDNAEFELKIETDDSFGLDDSGPKIQEKQKKSVQEIERHEIITKNAGTKTFASPEQLAADIEKFDERADIWSLGLLFLLLFHPMSTQMEEIQVLASAKRGQLPPDFEKNHPKIGDIIKKMLAKDPASRPSLEEILKQLPVKFSGKLYLKRENAVEWASKWIKLEDQFLYVYNSESDKKAENILSLNFWQAIYQDNNDKLINSMDESHSPNFLSNSDDNLNNSISDSGSIPMILLENESQLGYHLRGFSSQQTLEVYKILRKI